MINTIGFLLFDGFEDLDFFGPWEMLGLWSQQYGGPQQLHLISESGTQVCSVKGLMLNVAYDFASCPKLDVLFIPGGQGTRTEVDNQNLTRFIAKTSKQCQYLLSVCTGVFLYHAAGVLKTQKVCTHWASIERLRQQSELTVCEQRYVVDGDFWSSAGVSAGTDMSLAFIAALAGDEVCGKVQLHAEYYPEVKHYGPQENMPSYVKK